MATAVVIPNPEEIAEIVPPITDATAEAIAESVAEEVTDELEDELTWLRNDLTSLRQELSSTTTRLQEIRDLVFPMTEHNQSLMRMVTELTGQITSLSIASSTQAISEIPLETEAIPAILPASVEEDQPEARTEEAPVIPVLRRRRAI